MRWWLIVLILIVLILSLAALGLAIAGMVMRGRGRRGRHGRRGRSGRPGDTGAGWLSPTGSSYYGGAIGRTAIAGSTVIFPFGATNGSAIILAPGGARTITYPLDPTNPTSIGQLDNGAWAEIGTGTAHDLQVVPPNSSASVPGMTLSARVWKRTSCNGAWGPTAIAGSYTYPDTDPVTGAACLADHVNVQPFVAGDRFAIVVSTDTGTFVPTIAYPAYDSFSSGLGYTLL